MDAKAQKAAAALAVTVEEAQAAITKFYAELQETTANRAASNREDEKRYVEDRDAAVEADSWQTVCKLVDLHQQARATPCARQPVVCPRHLNCARGV